MADVSFINNNVPTWCAPYGALHLRLTQYITRDEVLKGAVVQRSDASGMRSAGMTLVELMVAIGVTTIIMALSTMIFMAQFKSYRSGHAVKTTEADIQKGLELVQDDVKLAGWGVKPEMAFYVTDGGGNGTDRITVSDNTVIDSQNATQLLLLVDSGIMRCGGCRRYQGLNKDSTDHGGSGDINGDLKADLSNGPVLVWAEDGNQTRVRTVAGGSVGSAGALDSDAGFGVSERWVTPAIQYFVSDNATTRISALYRHDRYTGVASQPVAEDVVDLQVIYGDNSTSPPSTNVWTPASVAGAAMYGALNCAGVNRCQYSPFNAGNIRWMNLYMVTRSTERTKPADDTGSCRPAVANRSAGTVAGGECGYTYRVYVTRITPMGNIR
jgi:hypothetical protein